MLTVIFLLAQSLYTLTTNAQIVFVNQAKTWADAQADCESMGTDLLTAQGNPAVCET